MLFTRLVSLFLIHNDVVCLCGNDLDTSCPIVLPAGQAFARIGNTACHNITTITGPAGFGAGVNCSGPHNDGDANTDTIRVRRVILLPFSSAGPFLSARSTGRYGLQEFYNIFIQPGFAADNVLWTPVQNWFRLAVTQDVNKNPVCWESLPSPPEFLPILRD